MAEIFDIPSAHTKQMIDDEVAVCLGGLKKSCKLTLSLFMKMVARRPELGMDGILTDDDIAFAGSIFRMERKLDTVRETLTRQMDATWRAFEIIQSRNGTGETSEIPPFGPEWMTDILAGAAEAVPSLSVREMLDELPMALLIHLVAAAHRKNGGITRRPDDQAAIAETLRMINQ